MSSLLRCGVQGLPAAETALVRTLFRLYQHGTSDFRWSLVDSAPYDAILVDSNSPHLATEHGHDGVKAVLTLTRPLRSEMLETWLLQTQREFFPEGMAARPVEAVQAPLPARPAAAQTPVPAPQANAYKLMRWPPAAMLRNDPTLIRMATVLSRRAMTITELAQVSQQPLDNAQAFALALRDAGMLVSPITVKLPAQPLPDAVAPRIATPPRQAERSLMNRIRLRLGL